MLRWLLEVIAFAVIARAISRVVAGVFEGLGSDARDSRGSSAPSQGVQMQKDPICGTYVVADRALSLSDGATRVYFCSATCRDQYRAELGDLRPSQQNRGTKSA
jgi:hypothetical protein